MAYPDRKYSFIRSLRFALSGIMTALKHERHVQFHAFATVSVMIAGFLTGITWEEWRSIWLITALVLSLELVNTAIEKGIDLTTSEFHPLAKTAKDVAAGAVLIASISSLLIGASIFFPYWF